MRRVILSFAQTFIIKNKNKIKMLEKRKFAEST